MLQWPEETISTDGEVPRWEHAGSNRMLDLHGDPLAAELVVFSDGNHHMALRDALRLFREQHPGLGGIFYTTTPPGPLLQWVRRGTLRFGNFQLALAPHLVISPPHVLGQLAEEGWIADTTPLARHRGAVLLVRRGNPKGIGGVADLAREEVKLFLSNPESEAVSYGGYEETLRALAAREGVTLPSLGKEAGKVVFGERIHHREAPQAVADGRADAAVVYYHLALRYCRIFPSLFEWVGLPGAEAFSGEVHTAVVGDGGTWGGRLARFLASPETASIYRQHGLDGIAPRPV
ncbi:molybdate ABC transporter substrate-binding protein [Endothiovibrio diazotrophicus]